MLVAVWTVFLFVMLFFLGSAVGSFLNVCIVRLPQGRSLIRPPSCCGQCGKAIRWEDNIPLVSYWLLRGRCRACGASFSMRYFWIELLTGFVFVLIYYLEIGRNVHHFRFLALYQTDSLYLVIEMFRPRPWLVFTVHALLSCFLIVATMCSNEQHIVPRSVTVSGILLGLLAAVLFPWPWPDDAAEAVAPLGGTSMNYARDQNPYVWGWRVGPMPAERPWWTGDVTPRAGLYPWPVWGPLPEWMPAGSRLLGVATGLCGIVTGAIFMGFFRLAFNLGAGAAVMGWGETSLLTIAGGFLGWQPILVAGLLGLIPGLIEALWQWTGKRQPRITIAFWLALAVAGVGLGWHWIGPLVQRAFFHPTRFLLLLAVWTVSLVVLSVWLHTAGIAPTALRPSMTQEDSTQQPSREIP
jgi:leader peptidase (prepilin peptidase)/N-methyltransferase